MPVPKRAPSESVAMNPLCPADGSAGARAEGAVTVNLLAVTELVGTDER
jgi:uncharacterized protein CbrC (UPF0167 family)